MACYLIACPHRTTEGLFSLSLGYMAADLRWDVPRAQEALEQVISKGLVRYDADAEVCLIMKALKRQAPANENVRKAALKRLVGVPETPLWMDFYELAQRYCGPFAADLRKAFGERFQIPSDSAESETVPQTQPETQPEISSSSSSSSSYEGATAPSVEQGLDKAGGGADQVFEYWRLITRRPGAKPLPERMRTIRARLRHFTADELMLAVDGSQTDDAVNREGHRFDDFKNIFRNGDNVSTNIQRAQAAKSGDDYQAWIAQLNARRNAA